MVKLRNALILGAVVVCALISMSHCGLIKDTIFFRSLTQAEQQAFIEMAIAYHDAPDSSDGNAILPKYPVIKPKSDDIPPAVFSTMMNGKVPKEWMKNFVRYLQDRLKITKISLDKYRAAESDQLCTEEGRCYSIRDVGQKCCPFG